MQLLVGYAIDPNLIKTLIIYFVKIVDKFGQNPLNFTFTKYGNVFM